jgi:hypothetical protein
MPEYMANIYQQLETEMWKPIKEIDLVKLAYLLGAVESLRKFTGHGVPEIELAYIKLRLLTGRELECL